MIVLKMLRLSNPFVLDLRSVALFRIAFGCILFFDLLNRIGDAELFLSDDGVLSRADLLSVVDKPWSFSVYMMFGETSQVTLILVLHLIVAALLIFGLWTRVVTIVSWALILSLLHRNPLNLNGGDTLFSVYAFWLMFLPSNARWSLDALLARKNGTEDFFERNKYLGLPGIAITLQTLFVYVFTVILKTGDMWASGEVVHYVVRNQALIKEPALWFQGFEGWFVPFSRATFHWEWFGCALLLCPIFNAWTRSVAIFGYVLMHAAFGFMLDIAIFAPVSIMSWLIFIPAGWWTISTSLDRTMKRLVNLGERLATFIPRGGAVIVPGWRSAWIVGVAICLVFVWNLRGLPNSPLRSMVPKPMENLMYLVKLRQKWAMFAPNPTKFSSWYALEAQLANGDSVDLFKPSQNFSLRRPRLFTDRTPDRRWGKYMGNLKRGKNVRIRDDFVEYFANRWNRGVDPTFQIIKVNFLYIKERIGEDGKYYDRDVRTLKTVHMKGVSQVVGDKAPYTSDAEQEESDI